MSFWLKGRGCAIPCFLWASLRTSRCCQGFWSLWFGSFFNMTYSPSLLGSCKKRSVLLLSLWSTLIQSTDYSHVFVCSSLNSAHITCWKSMPVEWIIKWDWKCCKVPFLTNTFPKWQQLFLYTSNQMSENKRTNFNHSYSGFLLDLKRYFQKNPMWFAFKFLFPQAYAA